MTMTEVNTKVRIREKAKELFLRYGIRSVSMDDIATQLGMSKKTIYQFFVDKNELVEEVVDDDIRQMQAECNHCHDRAKDAIDEIFQVVEQIISQCQNMNPMVIYDMQKFHVRSYQRFMEHKNKYMLQMIRKNLEWGIKDELYRPDIDVDVLSKFRLESMMMGFNMDLYPPSHYNLAQVTTTIIEHFVFGVASLKGYRQILKYHRKETKKQKTMNRYLTKINKLALVFLLAGVVGHSANAQEHHEFSVKQAVDYGLKNSVQVKNALLDVKIQEQTNRGITAAAYPHLNGSISGTYNPNIATQSFPNFIGAATYQVLQQEGVKNGSGSPIIPPSDFGLIQAQFGTKYNASVGADLSQLLFDGQVFVGLKARATSIDWQNKNVEVTEETIKANIYKIYYQLVVSKTQIDLLDANIDRLDKLEHDTREMYKNGFAEKLDIDKVTVQISNLQTEKSKALNDIQNGYLGLKLLMGMPMKDSLVLTDTISDNQVKEGVLETDNYKYGDGWNINMPN